jgi:beta-lactamase regulating signal transducer with metallopeptidase domain
MTTFYEWVSEASVWWWPRFADHLWQTTLFVLVVAVAAFALRQSPARLRHNFWLLASAKFIVPAVLFVFLAQVAGIESLPFLRDAQTTEQNALLVTGVTEPVSAMALDYEVTVIANPINDHKDIYLALTAVWFIGFATLVSVWAIRRRTFLRSLKLGRRLQTGREWQALTRARDTLHLQTRVGLLISPLQIEPAACRVWRPVVVMPESIANQLDDEELEAIMLHELVHIQRRDNLIGSMQLALCALLWFHPLVWFISRRLFDEREQACDERVMEVCGASEVYASSILKVVRFCFGWKVAGVTGAASGSNLRRRIENIMSRGNTKRSPGTVSSLLASALVGVALVVLVGAGVYSRAQGRDGRNANTSDVAVTSLEIAPPGNADVAFSHDYVSGWTTQKSKPGMPPPPPPALAEPPPPGQPPQASQAPGPPSPPDPVQNVLPAQVPQPSQAPNPSSVPKPAQAPQPSQAPQMPPPPPPAQGPKPEHLAPAGMGFGSGAGKGIAPATASGFGRAVGAGGGVGGRAPGASTIRPAAASGVGHGVGVGGVAPSIAPSTTAPASPATAPAPRALPAEPEESGPPTKKKVGKGGSRPREDVRIALIEATRKPISLTNTLVLFRVI